MSNKTEYCTPGFWLCGDKAQCVLRGYALAEGDFISNLCDGVEHCKDGSDEHLSQCIEVRFFSRTQDLPAKTCFKVYQESARSSVIFLLFVTPLLLGILICCRGRLLQCFRNIVSSQSGHSESKTYQRNEVIMKR